MDKLAILILAFFAGLGVQAIVDYAIRTAGSGSGIATGFAIVAALNTMIFLLLIQRRKK